MNTYQDMIEDMNKAKARQEKAMLALKKAKEREARANKKQAVGSLPRRGQTRGPLRPLWESAGLHGHWASPRQEQ